VKSNIFLQDKALKLVGPNSKILELGSGDGTHRLSKSFDSVVSIEHDEKYITEYSIHVPLAPYKDPHFTEASWWYDPVKLKKALPNDYDLIIVDGPKGNQGRAGFYTYLDLFKVDVPILFDDVYRMWDFRLMGAVANRLRVPAVLHTPHPRRWFGVVNAASRSLL